MTGRLVDMAFTLGGKQRVTLEINGDFREIWDKLHQEPVLDVEIKKHREKRSLSANAYFHVLCNKISAETGESEDAVKRRLVVSYGALARDKDGKPVGLKLPPTVDPSDFYPYVRLYETRQENGKDYSCYFVYKESHKMDSKEFARLVDGAIEEAKELGIQTTFNFLGPLANPARPQAQAIGVANLELADLVAGVLAARGNRGMVFHGEDGLDELTTTTSSDIWLISDGQVVRTELDPNDLGVTPSLPTDLVGGKPEHNAQVVRDVFAGAAGPVRDIVLVNAAAALLAFDGPSLMTPVAEQLRSKLGRAAAAIDEGKATALLDSWIEATQRAVAAGR